MPDEWRRWEVTKYKYCVTPLYSSIYFSDSFLLSLPTIKHKYLHFLLLTLLKLGVNAFEGNY